ncbi:MAG TPA: DUF882 domain-containing protein, partial [Casimicrobiaceae bacterium]
HTGEKLSLVYAVGDRYVAAALDAVRQFLRDFRNGATHAIDPVLLDQLHLLATATATRAPFQSRFWICEGCDRVYREGSHWRRMGQWVAAVARRPHAGPRGLADLPQRPT